MAPTQQLPTTPPPACAGTTLPTTVSSTNLTCYLGSPVTAAGNGAVSAPSTVQVSATSYGPADFKVCFAASGFSNGLPARLYYGAGSLIQASSMIYGQLTNVTDVIACTSNKCNSPISDACATAGGMLPTLTSPLCGGLSASGAPPSPATTGIACYNNANSTALALQATPVGNLCVALTRRCEGVSDPLCRGKAAGTVMRLYTDVNTLIAAIGGPSAATSYSTTVGNLFQGALMTTPDHPFRGSINDLLLCNTAGW